jgi:hypothetical protein
MKINQKLLIETGCFLPDLEFVQTRKKEKSKKYRSRRKFSLNFYKPSVETLSYENQNFDIGRDTEKHHDIFTNHASQQDEPTQFNNFEDFSNYSNDEPSIKDDLFYERNPDSDEFNYKDCQQDQFLRNFFGKNYLYDGAEIDVQDFYMAIHTLKIKHSLNRKTVDDILSLINLILPKNNRCPQTSQKIENFLSLQNKHHNVFFCCSICETIISDKKLDPNAKNILCAICSNETCPFVTFAIEPQIRHILDNKNLFNQVLQSNAKNSQSNQIIDLHDGIVYKNAKNNSSCRLISLLLNTDGAPITNSRQYSLWPVLATIVEFEPNSRENFNHMVVLGNLLINF